MTTHPPVCPANRGQSHSFVTRCARIPSAKHNGLCQCADSCLRCKFCGLEWLRHNIAFPPPEKEEVIWNKR